MTRARWAGAFGIALACGAMQLALAGAQVPVAITPSVDGSVIRALRMKKLDAHLNVSPETLKQECRFESEINEAPPDKVVALTFDDGPDPVHTPLILAVLAKYHVPATFFMIGEKARAHPELVAQVERAPLALVGGHSWSHPNFHDIPLREQLSELTRSERTPAVAGDVKLFRYPYGNATCAANAALHEAHYKIVGWNVDSCDWAFDHHGAVDAREALVCGVLPQNRANFQEHVLASVRAHRGGIILMHEIHPHTIVQLEQIVVQLLADGYVFARLDEARMAPLLR
jgi:peptidoglycan/xylan/chitin deacetylase (PgdA/CDA1 family)